LSPSRRSGFVADFPSRAFLTLVHSLSPA
jgi:hypothetical protein